MADPVPRGPGRPRKIDRDAIVAAVLAEGFAGITVGAVAARLGVTVVTVYRHVPDRAAMLAMAWDDVVATTRWPDPDLPWPQLLHSTAVTMWRLLEAHAGAASALSTGPVPPAMVAVYDDLAVALVGQGFTAADAVLAVDLVIDLAIDHRLGVERIDGRTGNSLPVRDSLAAVWAPSDSDGAALRQVKQVMVDAINLPPFDWFGRKLTLVLAGIWSQSAPGADTGEPGRCQGGP